MADKLTEKDLCVALSDFFVDNEVDFQKIAAVAKNFNIDLVEKALFQWVSPVCFANVQANIPSVWTFFEPEQLWAAIQQDIDKSSTENFFARAIRKFNEKRARLFFSSDWKKLVDATNRQRMVGRM